MNRQSGVDIDLGNRCSSNAYNWARKTFINRQQKPGQLLQGLDGAFSNVMQFNDVRLGISSDGIGTKIELAERTGIYHTLGHDLVAMTADDLAANGFEPTSLSNILDVDILDYEIVDQLMQGLHAAAGLAGLAVTGGEIAELGSRIGGYGSRMHFNWCSTALGYLPDRLVKPVDGSLIREGDMIISLASRGFRSNGFSLVRRIMTDNFGPDWHLVLYDNARTWGEVLLTPSLIYCTLINTLLTQELNLHGIVHITGGGIPDNLARVLKQSGWGAVIDKPCPALAFMLQVQTMGRIADQQAYRLWNMGNGMLLIVSQKDMDNVLVTAENAGFTARRAGRISVGKSIKITTTSGRHLSYPVES